ncbi:MAG: 3-carboxymuconate cyclase [Pedosphaera sp.]|nr:3-carboxymuconate cyclase [Pedosphaera sp.]
MVWLAFFLLLAPAVGRAEVQVLHAFEFGPQKPQSRLLQAADGNFYGTAVSGGASASVGGSGNGCIFRATSAGLITNMVSFFGTNGANPFGALVQAADGTLYGTTQNGGAHNAGTVFSYSIGGALTVLYSFGGTDGANPQTGLAFGSDGALYGTTYYGGTNGYGALFRITTGGAFTTIHSFAVTNPYPATALCLGADNNFYGATAYGPANGSSYYTAGTLFSITPAGTFTQLVGLTNTIGINPGNTFTLGGDGAIYGTLQGGGTDGVGTAFRLTTNGNFTVLASLLFSGSGGLARGGLTLLAGTNFYGTALSSSSGYGSVFKLSVNTNNYGNSSVQLVGLFNGVANGDAPIGGLVLATDGKFYGVTKDGGNANGGMFFNVPNNGPITPVASLTVSDGAGPESTLTFGPDGKLYGTTINGGPGDAGTVFRITTNGIYSLMATFGGTNGINPIAKLCVGADGALYGSTYNGGLGANGLPVTSGTLFRLTIGGSFQNIYTFNSSQSGGNAYGGMAVGPDGLLYGTTQFGGTNNGQGTIFRLTPNGTNYVFTNLVLFVGTNGANPQGTLLNGGDGFMYGTTFAGGTNNNGTIFRFDTNGVFNTVATFMVTNGLQPLGGLVRGPDGAFYGGGYGNFSNSRRIYRVTTNGTLTSVFALPGNYGSLQFGSLVAGTDGYLYDALYDGGTGNGGMLFRITTNGVAAVVSSFSAAIGIQPFGAPIFAPDGNLYGTTHNYGPGGGGTVYRFMFDSITSITQNGTNAVITATGTSGGSYGLYASTNLSLGAWTSLGNVTATNSVVQFKDANAGTFPQRFYRTAAQ